MACDVATLLAQACEDGYTGLSDRDLDLALVASMLPAQGYPTAATILAQGICYQGYSDRQLEEMLTAQLCLNL